MQTDRKLRWKIEPMLGGLALLLLLAGCVMVMRPFLSALMWAIVLAYSMNPLQNIFIKWFRSRTLAACLVTLTLTVTLAGPIVLIGFSLAEDGKALANASRKWFLAAPEQPPEWMENTPFVGDEMASYWTDFTEGRKRWLDQLDEAAADEPPEPPRPKVVIENGDDLIVSETPPPLINEETTAVAEKPESPQLMLLLGRSIAWARTALITIGLGVFHGVAEVLLSAFLAFFLLRHAPVLAERLNVGVDRLAAGRGRRLIKVAADTVRGVVYGFIGTALVQAVAAGLGFWMAGVPGAVLLAAMTFFFAVIPFGPPIIWIPAALWLFSQGQTGWGIFMLIWGTFVISGVDNVLRPILISQGSKMPFVLIFCGVVGGAIAFGLVGVFLGPTLLAVAFRLVEEWSADPDSLEREISATEETSVLQEGV